MTLRRRPRTRLIKLTAFTSAASLVLVLAACGSSSPSGGTSAPPSSAPAAAGSTGTTGSSSLPASGKGTGTGTVKIGVQCSSTGYAAEPECISTFNALAAYANANGGINGYKIAIDNCDTSSELTNPSVGAQCATKQITQDGDVAFVGLNGPLGVTAVAQAHSVPIISPIDVEPDYDTSPISFPVYAWQAGAWQSLIDYLSTHGFKHPAYTNTDSTIGAAAVAAVNYGYKKLGITPKSVVALLTAVTFQPQVETLSAEGVDSVFPILADPAIVSMVQESNAIGFHPAWATDWDAYDQRVEKILGPLGSSASLYTTMPFKSYETAGSLEKSTVAKYAPGQSWEFSFVSILNWIGMEILFQALEKMSGPATSAALLTQLHSDSFTSEWLPAAVNWQNTTGPNCQIASTEAYIAKMENGVWTQVYGPFNAPPAAVTGCHTGT
jgi:ABC-type branched-subunit amino acid transport system substrate-binding protein